MKIAPEVDPRSAKPVPFFIAWAALMLLAAVSVWSAFRTPGLWAPAIQFGIAAVQAGAVFLLFMRLKGPPKLKWVFAGSGFFWLLFLYGLSFTDYATRRGWPPGH